MVTPLAETALSDFGEFEEWLDVKGLLNVDALYRGHARSIWSLESTLYRHQCDLYHGRHPSLEVPVTQYSDAAKRVQAIVETHTAHRFGDVTASAELFPTTTHRFSFRYAVYLRHHGFPSPLLDWSLSPYVAAYFAFIDASTQADTKEDDGNGESRAAIYVLYPQQQPQKSGLVPPHGSLGEEGGIHFWGNAVTGETRHYDQQSAYSTALRYVKYGPNEVGSYRYGSHEYILRNFSAGSTGTIDGAVCWKVTLPRHDRESVLRRLDRMNINAYTLFRTEDALVRTYGLRELRRLGDVA